MFKKILNTFRKAKTTPEAPGGTSKDPKARIRRAPR